MYKKFIFAIIILFVFSIQINAQNQEKKTTFGIQYKPLFESGFIGSSKLEIKNEIFQSIFHQKYGYSFGAIIRFPIWKNLYIETGLAQIKRNFTVNYNTLDSNFISAKNLSFTSHDIPVNTLIFVKLSEDFYLNTSLGISLVHNPSNVSSQITYENHILFKAEGRKRNSFALEFNVNSGIEYRNIKFGGFYIGACGRIPLKPIFDVATMYQNTNSKQILFGSLSGTYVAVDLRYFFPKTKKSTINSETGPLDE